MPQIRIGDLVASMGFSFKPDDTTTSTNIVLTDDPVLQQPVRAGTSYLVELYLLVNNAAANAQFKFALNAPAGSTFNGTYISNVLTATAFTESIQRTDVAPGTVTAVVTGAIDGVV